MSTITVDDIHVIVSAWERLERCYGTLDQLRMCREHTQDTLSKYGAYTNSYSRKRNAQPATATAGQPENKRLKRKHDDEAQKTEKRTPKNTKGATSKPSPSNTNASAAEKSTTKKRKTADNKTATYEEGAVRDPAKDNVTVFLSNLSYDITQDEVINAFPELNIKNLDLVTTINGRGRGFGYMELENEQEVEKALGFDRRFLNGRPVYISSMLRDKSQRAKFKFSDSVEPTKLFVKGLPNDTTKEELETLFGQFGTVKDVRLVYHK